MNPQPQRIKNLIVKIAERCNLNCSYCYMYNHADQSYLNRPPFMSEKVFRQLLARIAEYCSGAPGQRMSLTFHGGEPMLMTPRMFCNLARAAEETLGDALSGMSMQTNATRVTGEWIEALQRHKVTVGVSIDGPPSVHDQVRVDHRGGGSHDLTVSGLMRLQEAKLLTRALCVVNPGYSGLSVFRHFLSLGIKRMNFLIPDASHDSKPLLYAGLGPTPVSDFLIPIFDEWFSNDDPEISIGLFEDLLRGLLGGSPNTDVLGNFLACYLVIDTDGAIHSNDVLKVCDEGVSSSGLNVFEHGFGDLQQGLPFFARVMSEGVPLSQQCQQCAERAICGGGYLPHRYARANGFDNPSIWCRDLLALIGHIRTRVADVAAA